MRLSRQKRIMLGTAVCFCCVRGCILGYITYISGSDMYCIYIVGAIACIYALISNVDLLFTGLALYAVFEFMLVALFPPTIVALIGFVPTGEFLVSAKLGIRELSDDLPQTLRYLEWSVPSWTILLVILARISATQE